MTDNDIIMSLKAFNGYTIIYLAIKLIERQKAEIEHLKSVIKDMSEDGEENA